MLSGILRPDLLPQELDERGQLLLELGAVAKVDVKEASQEVGNRLGRSAEQWEILKSPRVCPWASPQASSA